MFSLPSFYGFSGFLPLALPFIFGFSHPFLGFLVPSLIFASFLSCLLLRSCWLFSFLLHLFFLPFVSLAFIRTSFLLFLLLAFFASLFLLSVVSSSPLSQLFNR